MLPTTVHLFFVYGLQEVIMDGSFHLKNVYTQVYSPKSLYLLRLLQSCTLCISKTFWFKPVVFSFNSLNICLECVYIYRFTSCRTELCASTKIQEKMEIWVVVLCRKKCFAILFPVKFLLHQDSIILLYKFSKISFAVLTLFHDLLSSLPPYTMCFFV